MKMNRVSIPTMNGIDRPTIWCFIDALKKDEDISRVKMLSCNSGYPAPPQKPKYAQQQAAIKCSVQTYLKAIAEEAQKNVESDGEEKRRKRRRKRRIALKCFKCPKEPCHS